MHRSLQIRSPLGQDHAAVLQSPSSHGRGRNASFDELLDQGEEHAVTALGDHEVDGHRQNLDVVRHGRVVLGLPDRHHKVGSFREGTDAADAEPGRGARW